MAAALMERMRRRRWSRAPTASTCIIGDDRSESRRWRRSDPDDDDGVGGVAAKVSSGEDEVWFLCCWVCLLFGERLEKEEA
ncbi:hypothetical protein LINPERPRIM_LOCUS31365 [Linum perenne]